MFPLRAAIPVAPWWMKGEMSWASTATPCDGCTRASSLGLNYAIIIDELTKILDGERIEYTMAGGGLSWTQPWFAYVFLPIGVLALIGGIILLVTSQKNGRAPRYLLALPQVWDLEKRLQEAAAALWKNGLCCAA